MVDLPAEIKAEILEEIKTKKIPKKEAEKILQRAKEIFEEKFAIEPGEAVGVIAAQSISEPTTQAALRTFHMAGAGSVAGGLDRAKELLTATANISTPVMKIYLKGDYAKDKEKAKKVAKEIVALRVKDIAKVKRDLEKREIYIVLNKKAMKEEDIDEKSVLAKAATYSKVKPEIEGNNIVIALPNESLKKIAAIAMKIENAMLRGISKIDNTLVNEEDGEFIIYTIGSNLKAVLKHDAIDATRTTTNNIREIEAQLGIEAARRALLEEMKQLYSGSLNTDVRHLRLVADAMTYTGAIKGIGRTGISGSKASVLARIAFEESSKNMFNAVLFGEKEEFKGVAENIIAGKLVRVGTGIVKILMK